MSLYEWCLEVEKYVRYIKRDSEKRWVQTREIIAAIYNVNRDSTKKPEPFTGKDIIRLSFDEESTEVDIISIEESNAEYFKQMKARAGTKFRKNG